MSSRKQRKKLGGEHLQRIIDLCKSVEERSLDPFLVDVDDIIGIIREYFPEWKSLDEFSLDAEAISRLASVIKLQSDWVRNRSTSLYTDPFLLEEKIRRLDKEELVSILSLFSKTHSYAFFKPSLMSVLGSYPKIFLAFSIDALLF